MPVFCSREAAAISLIMSVTRFTEATMSRSVSPLDSTCLEPASTFSAESLIRFLISLAAAALRCARSRTSAATTANPRPCSPARAASTAALSARMLVWKAISSMVVMISAMRLDDWVISFIALTAAPTTAPPFSATSREVAASCAACCALSAFCFTVAATSSRLAAVSSRPEACSCAPLEISSAAPDSWCEAVATSSATLRTSRIAVLTAAIVALRALAVSPSSSYESRSRWTE